MARPVNKTPFYVALALIAVAGVTAIWLARQSSAGGAGREVGPVPVSAEAFDGHVLGSDSAPVEVIEYSSFTCGFCGRFAVLTMPDVQTRLIQTGQVRWKYRDFPLDPLSERAHHAGACAGEQGLFWPMHDQLFFNQGRWTRDRRPERVFRDFARQIGVDLSAFDACMDDNRYVGRIAATRQAGADLGINSTPTFIINGRVYTSFRPFDEFNRLIQQAAGEGQ
jgi:protein-disulfide isomerase